MSSSWGQNIKISLFGESHGTGIGAVIDNIPSGIPIDLDKISVMMARRAPGKEKYSTRRKEPDLIEILSGIHNGYTTGAPIAGIIFNKDKRSQDYKKMPLRPSHADYTGFLRYNGYNDPRGGGHFSARLTAPLVFAGSIAKQALETIDVTVAASIHSIYNIDDNKPNNISTENLKELLSKIFPVFDDKQGELMQAIIEETRLENDSLGGVVSAYVHGFPAGYGSPIYSGIENKIASIIFGIPAVRAVEFGLGFEAAKLKGSSHNDNYKIENNKVVTTTNNHGGVIGGISSGMPIELKVAFKPTPSIAKTQQSVDINTMEEVEINIKGRHDPCVVPRAVPCVESAIAIALLDTLLEGGHPNEPFRISRKD